MTAINRFNSLYSEQTVMAQPKEQELGLALMYTFTGKKKREHCILESACSAKL